MTSKYDHMFEHKIEIINGRKIPISVVKPEYRITHEEFERRLDKLLRKLIRRQEARKRKAREARKTT